MTSEQRRVVAKRWKLRNPEKLLSYRKKSKKKILATEKGQINRRMSKNMRRAVGDGKRLACDGVVHNLAEVEHLDWIGVGFAVHSVAENKIILAQPGEITRLSVAGPVDGPDGVTQAADGFLRRLSKRLLLEGTFRQKAERGG